MNVNIGDKIWFRYFGTPPVIVGYLVEISPNASLVKISDFDLKTYSSMSPTPPGLWCEIKEITILDCLNKEDLEEKKWVGFNVIT